MPRAQWAPLSTCLVRWRRQDYATVYRHDTVEKWSARYMYSHQACLLGGMVYFAGDEVSNALSDVVRYDPGSGARWLPWHMPALVLFCLRSAAACMQ